MKQLGIMIFILTCCRILYLMELMPLRGGHRLGFVGNICGERTSCKAGFTCNTGYMRRVVRLQGGRTYRFDCKGKISRGQMTVILWDPKCRTRLLELTAGESGEVKIDETCRCRLEFRFESADGNFDLSWEEI